MTPDLDAVRAMMEGVTRYDPSENMSMFDDGAWVRFTDFAALAAEVEANRATIAELQALVDACAPYLKEGETPAERIEREIKDAIMLMGMLANDRKERDAGRVTIAALEARVEALTRAAQDVLAERARQIGVEGWTPEHDDKHVRGELASAAAAYAAASTFYHADPYAAVLSIWPWQRAWLKPTSRRRDLVKAGALILAEIERLDRAALSGGTTDAR